MNLLGFLFIWALSFIFGMMAGFLCKGTLNQPQRPVIFNENPIVYEIPERENLEYRNFLNYDGSEQN